MMNRPGPWRPWGDYKPGAVCWFEGRLYRCEREHCAAVVPLFTGAGEWDPESLEAWSPRGCLDYWKPIIYPHWRTERRSIRAHLFGR